MKRDIVLVISHLVNDVLPPSVIEGRDGRTVHTQLAKFKQRILGIQKRAQWAAPEVQEPFWNELLINCEQFYPVINEDWLQEMSDCIRNTADFVPFFPSPPEAQPIADYSGEGENPPHTDGPDDQKPKGDHDRDVMNDDHPDHVAD